MKALAAIVNAIPRPLLFAVAAVIQAGLIAAMVFDRVRILREGTEVTLQTRPVDPRDFLRGDYVVLDYAISTVQTGPLKGTPVRYGMEVFVKLAPRPDGIYEVQSVHTEPVPVTGREVLLRSRAGRSNTCVEKGVLVFCDRMRLIYGIERYFVPEGEGRAIETARDKGTVQIVAAVTRSGRAAIKRLLLDGKPVYDEPLY